MKSVRLVKAGVVVGFFCLAGVAVAQTMMNTPSPKGASVYIISPANGEVVMQKFTVKFGLRGMGVAPAGTERDNTGHHHLLIDSKETPVYNQPMGSNVKHFGGGQTETMLTLKPGKHTLQLVLGDKSHIPHAPAVMSKKVTVFVR
ncbi:MAG: rod shape-determining protein RodA [SAR324 cluster bacterium]|uniref:Rod shape-determining protein RodA n=1 Tax=SAR324 cluster bacterium TaxID=2024889 RepID=A0A2A4T0F2_9DELT|nr:MAG: rod shape-determining protein RodA [SAR324 cluster bacterium]